MNEQRWSYPAGIPDLVERHLLNIRGGWRLAVIRVVAADEQGGGHHIGGSLLKRVRQMYRQCGCRTVYALMRHPRTSKWLVIVGRRMVASGMENRVDVATSVAPK